MMSSAPKNDRGHDGGGKKPITTNRIIIWAIVGGIGFFFLGSGIYGILTK